MNGGLPPRRRAVDRTVTVDDAIARALDIGANSSMAEHTIDITTLGARSGIPRRIEVWFHRVGGRWYLTGVLDPQNGPRLRRGSAGARTSTSGSRAARCPNSPNLSDR
jgi:hypothetical protein